MTNPFRVLDPTPSVLAPRVGRLVVPGRKPLQTPHYVATTSRGSVPHLSHDVMREHTSVDSLYFGMEDFLEKIPNQVPPIYKVPRAAHESALRKFASLQEDALLILGARRVPPVVCPLANTANSISILTSVGFRQLHAEQYSEGIQKLRPDIIIGLADLVHGQKPSVKRREKMVDRTHAYTRDAMKKLYKTEDGVESDLETLYFAPVLPLENTQQQLYFEDLTDELRPYVSGLALYESSSLSTIPEELGNLPRLLLDEPQTPQEVLRNISLGADIITIPFVGKMSDGGIALDFVFPPPKEDEDKPKTLGIDLWSSSYATDLSPLVQGCDCYACTKHHRAYLRHLLSAKEMLAWTLLQIHNYHMMDRFFAAVREAIINGTFEKDLQTFERAYESSLPQQTGQGPRLRGYHMHASGPGEPRRNPRAYGRLDDTIEKYAEAQSSVATPDAGANELQERGFAEKQ